VATPTEDRDWLTTLALCHDREMPELKLLNDEYELRAAQRYMHPDILRELGDRLQQVVIAWPQLVVDSLEERLDVEGFRLPDEDQADDDLWRVWQKNCCDEESQLGHVDALSMKRAYIAVGSNEDDADTPLVTFESPLEVYADIDPRTRKTRAALKRWIEYEGSLARMPERYATLYLPNRTVFYESSNGSDYTETGRDEHNLGETPIVPLINRGRLADRRGRSELSPVLPLVHSANKLATDMMVAAEFVAIPLRGFLGIGPDSFEDQNGNKLTALQAILGRMLTIPEDAQSVKQFEFAAAQLSNFHQAINQLAQLVASIAGLPPHYLGQLTDNPASADAIRSNEARLVKKAERRQRAFGGSHEQAMRLVKRFQEGDWDPRYRRLETIWRDPSTPTVAQKADAAVKLFNLPQPIVPMRQTREDLGYSDAQIARMEAEDEKQAARDLKMFQQETAAQMQSANTPVDVAAGNVPANQPA
jgi:hypothetical protein